MSRRVLLAWLALAAALFWLAVSVVDRDDSVDAAQINAAR